jgi:citrate lyase beta subunit
MEEKEEYLPYRVGGLLYCPACNQTVAKKIVDGELEGLTSICFCLEDSIADNKLIEAQANLQKTLAFIAKAEKAKEELPLLFVRARSVTHLREVYEENKENISVLTGFVLPKFDLSNAKQYMKQIKAFHKEGHRLYVMPTLESKGAAEGENRYRTLKKIKTILDENRQYVLNVRVGGNDFANLFGVRRSVTQNIYEISVIRNILADVLTVFSRDYVVSGPVWEYFGEDADGAWAKGLEEEMNLDVLNGFVGKTAIHPAQLPIIRKGMQVSKEDYEDAKAILQWSGEDDGVKKSERKTRMNEVKTHGRWARRIYALGCIYGVKDEK